MRDNIALKANAAPTLTNTDAEISHEQLAMLARYPHKRRLGRNLSNSLTLRGRWEDGIVATRYVDVRSVVRQFFRKKPT